MHLAVIIVYKFVVTRYGREKQCGGTRAMGGGKETREREGRREPNGEGDGKDTEESFN